MNDDLKAYFDQHFLAIAQQNQQLHQEMGQHVQQLRQEMGEQAQQLRQEMGEQIQELRQEFNQRLDRIEVDVRRAYVLIEDLQGKIQIVAEGVANCNEQLKRLDEKFTREIAEIKSFTRQAYNDLDVRVRRLEAAAK